MSSWSVSRTLHGQPLGDGQVFLTIEVAPAERRCGLGASMYQSALQQALAMGATSLACSVAADDLDSLAFAIRRGFREDYTMLESRLDLATFDPAPFAGAVAACEARNIRFTSLLQQQDDPVLMQNLYELDEAISYDIPNWAGLMPPLPEFAASLRECDPEAVFIAWDGGQTVGYSATSDEGDGTAYTHILGVLPSHRGRGIALALKLLTIGWAQRRGITALLTHNNAANTSVIALNRRLGYIMTPSQIYLAREVPTPQE